MSYWHTAGSERKATWSSDRSPTVWDQATVRHPLTSTSAEAASSTTAGNQFSGSLDEVAIWDVALSASQIEGMVQAALTDGGDFAQTVLQTSPTRILAAE